jgi:hypothetical protein
MAAFVPRVIWELTPTVQGALIRGSNSYGSRGCLRARPFSAVKKSRRLPHPSPIRFLFFRANTKNRLISLAPVRSIYTARSSEFTLRNAQMLEITRVLRAVTL